MSKSDPERVISTTEIWAKYKLRKMLFYAMKKHPKVGVFFTVSGFERRLAKNHFEHFEVFHDAGMDTAEQRADVEAMIIAPEDRNLYYSEITKKFHLTQAEQETTFSTTNWRALCNFLDGANLGVNTRNPQGIKWLLQEHQDVSEWRYDSAGSG
jgi:hypothetical protein